jgi:hypothetical protein
MVLSCTIHYWQSEESRETYDVSAEIGFKLSFQPEIIAPLSSIVSIRSFLWLRCPDTLGNYQVWRLLRRFVGQLLFYFSLSLRLICMTFTSRNVRMCFFYCNQTSHNNDTSWTSKMLIPFWCFSNRYWIDWKQVHNQEICISLLSRSDSVWIFLSVTFGWFGSIMDCIAERKRESSLQLVRFLYFTPVGSA